nr:hypothetical protein [Romboutsia weinsteinii]
MDIRSMFGFSRCNRANKDKDRMTANVVLYLFSGTFIIQPLVTNSSDAPWIIQPMLIITTKCIASKPTNLLDNNYISTTPIINNINVTRFICNNPMPKPFI